MEIEKIKEIKRGFLQGIEEEIQEIKEEKQEIYFHNIGHDRVNEIISEMNNQELIDFIDDTGNAEYADNEIIDTSSVQKFLVTMGYECGYEEIFKDQFFKELEKELNNKKISNEKGKKILKKIEEYKEELKPA